MILNNEIINKIKAKSNLLFDKAGDFAVLSSLIFKETGRTIPVAENTEQYAKLFVKYKKIAAFLTELCHEQ